MSAAATDTRAERLAPRERLEQLCDPGSLQVIRTEVTSARMGPNARPGPIATMQAPFEVMRVSSWLTHRPRVR